jgi:hypothetical protein
MRLRTEAINHHTHNAPAIKTSIDRVVFGNVCSRADTV